MVQQLKLSILVIILSSVCATKSNAEPVNNETIYTACKEYISLMESNSLSTSLSKKGIYNTGVCFGAISGMMSVHAIVRKKSKEYRPYCLSSEITSTIIAKDFVSFIESYSKFKDTETNSGVSLLAAFMKRKYACDKNTSSSPPEL